MACTGREKTILRGGGWPIDADPTRLEQTAISIEAIIALMNCNRSSARQRLLMLDMNRSQSALPNQRLGVPTMELAKQHEIPSATILSGPTSFRKKTLAVRHGLFTRSHSGGATVSRVSDPIATGSLFK